MNLLRTTLYLISWRFFCRQKKPRRAHRQLAPGAWRHPITLRSLVVRSTALTQNFDICLTCFRVFLKLFEIIWDVSGGSLEVLRSNFRRKTFRYFYAFLKCLGGSRRVLGVPRTKILIYPENLIFVNLFLLLPIVLPIVLPIGLPIEFPIGLLLAQGVRHIPDDPEQL